VPEFFTFLPILFTDVPPPPEGQRNVPESFPVRLKERIRTFVQHIPVMGVEVNQMFAQIPPVLQPGAGVDTLDMQPGQQRHRYFYPGNQQAEGWGSVVTLNTFLVGNANYKPEILSVVALPSYTSRVNLRRGGRKY
jgi:hypothetical protein